MTLRKITVDNSVSYISQRERTQEGDNNPNTMKNNSLTRKQYKNFSQNIKKISCNKISRMF